MAIVLTLFFIAVLAIGCSPTSPRPMDNNTKTGEKTGPEKAEADQNRPDVLGSNKRVVMGFYVAGEGDIPSSKNSLTTNAKLLDEVSFFWYSFDSAGNIKNIAKQDLAAKSFAKRNNAKVYAVVHNMVAGQGFSPGLAHSVLAPGVRTKFIQNIVNLAKTQGWDGVAIDIEKAPPQDRGNFSAFIKELGAALKAKDKVLNVSIPAKFIDYPKDLWSGAYDYTAIGKAADQVVIMSYDEHGLGTTAGPIASHDWVDKVIGFATKKIPPQKIVMGIPVYGFDWGSKSPTVPAYVTFSQAQRTAKSKGVSITYDEETETPHFTFTERGIRHVVFFENQRSISVKLGYAKKHKIHGVAIWRMGMEDPSIWSSVQSYYGTNRNVAK
ncbi:MAG TPA: glycosyl hydrolase family 18 protein [Desulfobacteria bacterium]|nr:glycosyl hydrolase family 18 protein [Desulfobacteria bacterium]